MRLAAIPTNKTALYVLLAALALAALTNRWVAASGSRPGFNIVSFDDVFFGAQWIAFGLTLGALWLLASDWSASGRFPPLMLLGIGLVLFFVATGIPQTLNSYEWKSGDVGLKRWMRAFNQSRESDKVAPELLGTWRSGADSYQIEQDRLTITSGGETTVWSKATCVDGLSLKFGYATGRTIGYHPAAYKYHDLLDGPPIPSLEAICKTRVHNFLKLADGSVLALHDTHREDFRSEVLKR